MIEECPVCYEDITKEDILQCGHIVHERCVINSGKAECPICRSKLLYFVNKVIELKYDPPVWGTLDKLVSLGWLKHTDIPIIDELKLPYGDDLLLVKASILLYTIKRAFSITGL